MCGVPLVRVQTLDPLTALPGPLVSASSSLALDNNLVDNNLAFATDADLVRLTLIGGGRGFGAFFGKYTTGVVLVVLVLERVLRL